jgi:hypothetical protein
VSICYAGITSSKGWLGAATSLYSKGWLNYDIEIISVPIPRTTGPARRDKPRRQHRLRKKRITVRVTFSGETYERTVIVAQDVSITAQNVQLQKSGDQVEVIIQVDGIILD